MNRVRFCHLSPLSHVLVRRGSPFSFVPAWNFGWVKGRGLLTSLSLSHSLARFSYCCQLKRAVRQLLNYSTGCFLSHLAGVSCCLIRWRGTRKKWGEAVNSSNLVLWDRQGSAVWCLSLQKRATIYIGRLPIKKWFFNQHRFFSVLHIRSHLRWTCLRSLLRSIKNVERGRAVDLRMYYVH